MIKLSIGNSTCQLEGLTTEQFKSVKELLFYSEDPQAAFFSKSFRSPKRYLIDKKGFFPTGLLYIVESWLKEEKHPFQSDDKRIKPKPHNLFKSSMHVTPYLEQIDAATAVVERYRGIIAAPTGVGKSVIAALIIQKLQVNTLIVVPSLELKRQLTESLAGIFGQGHVGGVGHRIAVENVDALDPNDTFYDYGCVIIDEFHHSGAKTYRNLNKKSWKHIFYRVGLTATPFRSKDNERLLLESVLSQIIYRIEYSDAVAKGYIVPVEAYYYDIPETTTHANTWAGVYSTLVVNHEVRNAGVASLLNLLDATKRSALCLVKEIKHGEAIQALCHKQFANGLNFDTQILIKAFNDQKINCLIGTTGIIGEGVDTKPAEYIIIAGLGKSKNAFMQQVGRGLRRFKSKESCKVIIFRDKSHRWTLNHFKEECKILKEEYGVIPVAMGVIDAFN